MKTDELPYTLWLPDTATALNPIAICANAGATSNGAAVQGMIVPATSVWVRGKKVCLACPQYTTDIHSDPTGSMLNP